jgi:hypothetical protein
MKTGLFVDVANLYFCINKKFPTRKVNYKEYMQFVLEATDNPEKFEALAFVCKFDDEADAFVRKLNATGFSVESIISPKNKSVSLTTNIIVSILYSMNRFDRIVIGSASKEFLPFISYLKNMDKEVVVVACGICNEVRNAASSYFELDETHLEELRITNPGVEVETDKV